MKEGKRRNGSMLDFRMDTFLAVCRHMNFTAAAKELNLTQPAVSQHIRFLEKEYGQPLFSYEKKKLRLTKAGEFLLQIATTQKSDEERIRQQIKEIAMEEKTYHVGATKTVGEYAVLRPLALFLKNHPQMKLQMTISNTNDLLEKLVHQEINFAIVEGYFSKEAYDSMVYSTERYIAVCGKNYAWGSSETESGKQQKKELVLRDLLGERLFVREEGSGTREILEHNLKAHGLQLSDFKNQIEINSLPAILELVKQGCGITFVYETAAKEGIQKGELQEILLKDFLVEHDFTFVWNKGSIFEKEYRALCEKLKEKKQDM